MHRNLRRLIIGFAILFLVLPSLIGCVSAYEWSEEIVDFEHDVGTYASIVLDSNEYPHICYFSITGSTLKYARWSGAEWEIETVDSGDVSSLSIGIDSNDYPHISYYDRDNADLKYAKWNGTGWEIEIVDSAGTVGLFSSIGIDSNDYPHIAYRYDDPGPNLKYAKWNGTGWEIETVDSGNGSYISMTMAGDYPHISYMLSGDGVKYAYWNGTDWEISVVDDTEFVGYHTSIALDSNDYPHIAYEDDGHIEKIRYAYWNGTDWTKMVVEYVGSGCERKTSIAVDANDYPHILYPTNVNFLGIRYAKWNGTGWEIEKVGDYGASGYTHKSLVLDTSGYPHISYCNATNLDLIYAFKGPQISGKTKPFHGTPVVDVKNPKIETKMSGEDGKYSTVLRGEGNKKYEVHFEHTPQYPKTFHAGVSLTVSANRTEVEELTIIIRGLDPTISYTVTRDGITLNPEYWSKVGSIMTIIETSFSEHTYTITPIILAGDGGGGELPPTEVGAPAVSSRVTEPQKEIATLIFSIRGWFILLFSYLGAVIICRRIGNVLIAGTLGIILPIVIMYLFKFNIFLFEWMIQATGLLGTALAAITMMMYGLIFGFIMELEVD